MPIPNPVYGLMVPFLCIVTLPLAIFAGITTTLAFSVLMFRVMMVYLDIAVSLVPQYLMGRSTLAEQQRALTYGSLHTPGSRSPRPNDTGSGSGHNTPPLLLASGYHTSTQRSPTRSTAHAHFASAPASVMGPSAGRISRRGSAGGNSVASVGTITPVKEDTAGESWAEGDVGSRSFIMQNDQSSKVRDFEGVGGWRLGSDERGEDDDSDWANINSRLELPSERMRGQSHHHYRTPSGHAGSGTVTPGEGWLMMKGGRTRGEGVVVSTDVEKEVEVGWGSTGGVRIGGTSSGRASVSPNSSRVRIGQGVVAFAGVERNDGYFPPTASPRLSRKGTT